MQLSYQNNFDLGTPGQFMDMGPTNTEGHASCDPNNISFGYGLAWGLLLAGTVRLPRLNRTTLTLSTDLIAANSTIVTVNGVSTTATVYASSHAATMAAIVAKVQALAGVTAASYTGDVITITTGDSDAVATATITLGSSQPTVTVATLSIDTFAGLTGFEQLESTLEAIGSATAVDGAGASAGIGYQTTNMVKTVRLGRNLAPVVVSSAIANGTLAYMITASTNRGMLTDAASGNVKAGVFRSGTTTMSDGTVVATVQIDVPALN